VETNQLVYKLWTDGLEGSEYFLVENRQRVGFDYYLPGDGLLIYHVDQTDSNNNHEWYPGHTLFGNYLVALEQADGDWGLEQNINSGDNGDPWPGITAHTNYDSISTPNSRSYAFENTHVEVRNISGSQSTMTADLYVGYAPPDMLWFRTFGVNNNQRDVGRSVQQTTDGGYIIAGGSWRAVFDSVVCLIKTDATGNEQWNRIFDWGSGNSVQQTTDGGYIIGANTNGYIWLIKTDGAGNMQWNSTFPRYWGGDQYCYGVQQTTDGGYIIIGHDTGGFSGPCPYEGGGIWLIKTNVNGDSLWSRCIGFMTTGNETNIGYSIQLTTDGGYIIGGYTGNNPYYDAWLVKTDAMGYLQWYRTLGGSLHDFGHSAQQTTDGGYIIAGATNHSYPTDCDAFLIKTDATGNQEWNRTFGGSGWYEAYSVQQTTDGGYIIAGRMGFWQFIKTDAMGNQQWQQGCPFIIYSCQQTTDGGYIMTGEWGLDIGLARFGYQTTAIIDRSHHYPSEFALHPPYPNPFNPTTTFTFSLPRTSDLSLIIYNVEGRKAAVVAKGFYPGGLNRVVFDASDLSSGVYFVQLKTQGFSQTQKMVVLK
jgi:hypothetical protein